MNNKKVEKFNEILASEGGELRFQEQIIRIGTEVLDMDLQEANDMRKNVGKLNVNQLYSIHDKLLEALGTEEGNKAYSLLISRGAYCLSKLYVTTVRSIKIDALNSIIRSTDRRVKYGYQILMILKEVFDLSNDSAYHLIDYIEKATPEEAKEYMISYLKDFSPLREKEYKILVDDATDLIVESLPLLHNIPVALVPFLETAKN